MQSATTPRAPASSFTGIFLCSLGLLMLEILLTRVFSFSVWYHLAYLTIGTALLCFGAAGSLLAAFPSLLKSPMKLSAIAAAGAGISVLLCIFFLAPRPLDPVLLSEDPVKFFVGLLIYYACLVPPFLLGGLAIAAPLSAYSIQVNRVYAADLAGAALGCMCAVAALTWTTGPAALVLCAAILIASGALYATGTQLSFPLGILALIVAFLIPWADRIIHFEPAASKPLSYSISKVETYRVHTEWSAINRVDVIRNPQTMRFSWWGLPIYRGDKNIKIPESMEIHYDASNGSNIFNVTGPESMGFLDSHILSAPYEFLENPDVLIIGLGGGIDVHNAVRHGANSITAAELQPITIKVLTDMLSDYSGGVFERPDVNLVASEGRHFIQSHDDIFDLIQITATDTFAAQSTGAYVLAESYLYTVEAMEDYLDHLSEDGILCVVVGDRTYPDPDQPSPLATRMVLAIQQALWNRGVEDPAAHILLTMPVSVLSAVIMAKNSPYTEAELEKGQQFTEKNGFWYPLAPGTEGHPAMTRLLNTPQDSIKAALAKEDFQLHPATDDSPFFYHILRWRNLPKEIMQGHDFAFFSPGTSTGLIMLVMMLAQTLVFGTLLISLPLIRRRVNKKSNTGTFRYLLFFLGLGIGFMLLEISFVQKYVLLLGYPTYSLSVTIVSLLISASIGAALSHRGWSNPRKFLTGLLVVTAALIIVEALVMPSVIMNLLGTSLGVRIFVTVLTLFPLGLCLGMYFPTGIQILRRDHPGLVPWAWAVNGIGSVASTVIAVILAMSFGFSNVAFVALAVYAIGTIPIILSLGNERLGEAAAE